tara:strand:- start:2556 stop:2726 length:171 start_codon:yes stop_codon:yes gene_type:complete
MHRRVGRKEIIKRSYATLLGQYIYFTAIVMMRNGLSKPDISSLHPTEERATPDNKH